MKKIASTYFWNDNEGGLCHKGNIMSNHNTKKQCQVNFYVMNTNKLVVIYVKSSTAVHYPMWTSALHKHHSDSLLADLEVVVLDRSPHTNNIVLYVLYYVGKGYVYSACIIGE